MVFKKIFSAALIGVAVVAIHSCSDQYTDRRNSVEVPDFSSDSSSGFEVAFDPILSKLLGVEKYGPYYSRSVVVKDANGKTKREAIYCFTITKNNGWEISVRTLLDLNGDHKVNVVLEDTNGDGKPDKGKTDEKPYDGKFETKWTDQNGDGLVQPNELSRIDPQEEAPNMPNWL